MGNFREKKSPQFLFFQSLELFFCFCQKQLMHSGRWKQLCRIIKKSKNCNVVNIDLLFPLHKRSIILFIEEVLGDTVSAFSYISA